MHIYAYITIDELGEKYGQIKRYIDIDKESAFERVINACHLLLNEQIYLSVRINYLLDNLERAKEIFCALEERFSPIDRTRINMYLAQITLNSDCSDCPQNKADDKSFKELVRFHRAHNVINVRAKNEEQQFLSSFCLLPKIGSCGSHRRWNIVVRADGKLFKCHRLANEDKYSIGHVTTCVDYNSPNYTKFVTHEIKDEDCQKCNVLPLCQGGCIVIREMYDKNLECDIKNTQEDLLIEYYKAITNN